MRLVAWAHTAPSSAAAQGRTSKADHEPRSGQKDSRPPRSHRSALPGARWSRRHPRPAPGQRPARRGGDRERAPSRRRRRHSCWRGWRRSSRRQRRIDPVRLVRGELVGAEIEGKACQEGERVRHLRAIATGDHPPIPIARTILDLHDAAETAPLGSDRDLDPRARSRRAIVDLGGEVCTQGCSVRTAIGRPVHHLVAIAYASGRQGARGLHKQAQGNGGHRHVRSRH